MTVDPRNPPPYSGITFTHAFAPNPEVNRRGEMRFTAIAGAFGGAISVRYTPRVAWVNMPGRPEPVRVLRSKLPPLGKWSAFTLADAVANLEN